MLSRGEAEVVYGQSPPGLPAAAVGIGHRAGFVHAIKLHVKSAAIPAGSDADLESVTAIRQGVDGVPQPFAGGSPADIESAARIGRGFNVHRGASKLAAIIRRVGVVISHAFAAIVEVLRLDDA